MNDIRFAGALLRMLRLERNWSQETLCQGICAVSYLSKIEQGRVQPNEALLQALFAKLDVPWQNIPAEEGSALCESLYELVFSYDHEAIERSKEYGILRQEGLALGVHYLDYLVLRAYCCKDKDLIPDSIRPLLDTRQQCLAYLLEEKTQEAFFVYPCALTALNNGIRLYRNGDYGSALETLQHGYDKACQAGYARIMLFCQLFIANCYSDLQNVTNMLAHYDIARRLARAVGEQELIRTIDYNVASTRIECGDYEAGYAYFSKLENLSVLDSHKLAICCEKLNRPVEALTMLNAVRDEATGLKAQMCDLVRYRLKNKNYLKDPAYGELLLSTFNQIRQKLPMGYARFHLPWVEEWCSANRQYRMAYEILKDFTK